MQSIGKCSDRARQQLPPHTEARTLRRSSPLTSLYFLRAHDHRHPYTTRVCAFCSPSSPCRAVARALSSSLLPETLAITQSHIHAPRGVNLRGRSQWSNRSTRATHWARMSATRAPDHARHRIPVCGVNSA
jgi:hypothetical protein